MKKLPSFRLFSRKTMLLAISVTVLISSCGKNGGESITYEAEKALFRARKMRSNLSPTTVNSEFLTKTIQTYRDIVSKYEPSREKSHTLDSLVVTCQMELAQLEFHSGLLEKSREDFQTAIRLADSITAIKVNAIYSIALISEQLHDIQTAIEYYKKLYEEFLQTKTYSSIASLNVQYLKTPLELGKLYVSSGKETEADKWYRKAEKLFTRIIEKEKRPAYAKEAKFNKITALLQSKQWNKSKSYLQTLKKEYNSSEELPALLYLESQIELNGFNNRDKALKLLKQIEDNYPKADETPRALLAAAGIKFRGNRYEEAKKLYNKIIEKYSERGNETVEATWMIAKIEEKNGNWVEASLHYKSIYKKYPLTIQGFEAPLKIASHFTETGERTAAKNAFLNAREHYSKLTGDQYSRGVQLIAEEYIVTSLVTEEKWDKAVQQLLSLISKYPWYTPFRENFLRAALICENKLNDKKRAVTILNDFIKNFPESPLAEKAKKQLNRTRSKE
ncbi:tetratricopeptide repeat protein [bacterium]|nr:tetratricopeptide repeat protein [bacterium]